MAQARASMCARAPTGSHYRLPQTSSPVPSFFRIVPRALSCPPERFLGPLAGRVRAVAKRGAASRCATDACLPPMMSVRRRWVLAPLRLLLCW